MSDNEDGSLIAEKPGSAKKPSSGSNVQTATHLRAPDLDLVFKSNGDGTYTASIPRIKSGNPNEIPLLAVTYDKGEQLVGTANNLLLLPQNRDQSIRFSDVTVNLGGKVNANVNAEVDAPQIPFVGKLGKIAANLGGEFSPTLSFKITPPPGGLTEDVQQRIQNAFDAARTNEYAKWAKDYSGQNGAQNGTTIPLGDGKPSIRVPGNVANEYYQENKPLQDRFNEFLDGLKKNAAQTGEYLQQLNPLNIFKNKDSEKSLEKSEISTDAVARGLSLRDEKHPLHDQFAQALKGTHGDKDVAAVAVETIRNNPSYKENQPISVVEGKSGGFIVSQGQGDSAVNLAVPAAKPGDFERVSSQTATLPLNQPLAQQLDPPERVRTPTV